MARFVAERQEKQADVGLVEIAYGWRDLARLTDPPVDRTPPAFRHSCAGLPPTLPATLSCPMLGGQESADGTV